MHSQPRTMVFSHRSAGSDVTLERKTFKANLDSGSHFLTEVAGSTLLVQICL